MAKRLIEQAAYAAWAQCNDANFDLLLAYKHSDANDLTKVRAKLCKAIEAIDLVLEKEKA